MIRQLTKTAAPKLKATFLRSMSSTSYPNLNKFRIYTPEDGFVVNSIYDPISLPDLTVDQYVWKNISKWENKVAIVSCAEIIFVILTFKRKTLTDMWSNWSQVYLLETKGP